MSQLPRREVEDWVEIDKMPTENLFLWILGNQRWSQDSRAMSFLHWLQDGGVSIHAIFLRLVSDSTLREFSSILIVKLSELDAFAPLLLEYMSVFTRGVDHQMKPHLGWMKRERELCWRALFPKRNVPSCARSDFIH